MNKNEFIKKKREELDGFITNSQNMYGRNPSTEEIEDWLISFYDEAQTAKDGQAEVQVSREFCGHLIKNINEAHEKIRIAPELNPSNYTHKEAMQLNDDMIEAFRIIDGTLFLIKKNLPTEFAEYESKISG